MARASLVTQLKCLIKKDYQILRRHKRQMISLIVLPILTAVIAAFTFSSMNKNGPSQSGVGWALSNCGTQQWPRNYGNIYYSGSYEDIGSKYPCQSNNSYWGQYRNLRRFESTEDMLYNISSISLAAAGSKQGQYYSAPNMVGLDGLTDPTDVSVYYIPSATSQMSQLAMNLYPMLPGYNASKENVTRSNLKFRSRYFNQFAQRVMAATIASLVLMIGYLPLGFTSAAALVDEKSGKIREHLKVVGVSTTAYVLSHLTFNAIRALLTVASQTVLFGLITSLTGGSATSYLGVSHYIMMFFVLLLFALSVCTFAHFPAVFVAKPQLSNAIMSLWLLVAVVGANWSTLLPEGAQFALGFFFSGISSSYGLQQVLSAQWLELPMTIPVCLLFTAMAFVGHLLVAEYLLALFPGDYGVPKHWLFPLQMLGCCVDANDDEAKRNAAVFNKNSSPTAINAANAAAGGGGSSEEGKKGQEEEEEKRQAMIKIKNLTKYYGSQRETAANDKLTLTFYSGTISSLLGQNGCGKSTLMSQLVGMIPSTEYDEATVCGHDINTATDEIREHISLIPQHDILFGDLSAKEHVEFFCEVRGVANQRGADLLSAMDLPVTDQVSNTFSGGMKRRLSVACGLAADTDVILADEATASLDPQNRKLVHEIFRQERDKGKCIIWCSHFLDEVEHLSQPTETAPAGKIAVMSFGKIFAFETSSSLKQKYGVGYYLTLIKTQKQQQQQQNSSSPTAASSSSSSSPLKEQDLEMTSSPTNCDLNRLLSICTKHCPGSTLVHETPAEVTVLLPQPQQQHYGELLEHLEDTDTLSALGFSSFGISANSLEEVFVNIAEKETEKDRERRGVKTTEQEERELAAPLINFQVGQSPATAGDAFDSASTQQTGFVRSLWQIWYICRYLRFRFVKRSPRLLLLSGLVPFLLIGLGFGALIPMGGGGNNNGNNYYWNPSVLWPNVDEQVIPFVKMTGKGLQDPDEPFVQKVIQDQELDRIVANFRTLYLKQYPRANLKTPIVTHFEFSLFLYQAQTASAFTYQGTPSQEAFFFQELDLTKNATAEIGFCLGCADDSNDHVYSGSYRMILVTMFRAALNAAIPPIAPVDLRATFKEAPLFPNMTTTTTTQVATTATTTTTTAGPSTPSPVDRKQSFLTAPFAILVFVAVVQFSASNSLFVVDDLNRGSFEVLRISGCSAFSYYLGCLLFDLIYFLPSLLCFIVGTYIRGCTQLEYGAVMVGNCFSLLLIVANTSVLSYIVVNLLPRSLLPGTYLTFAVVINMLFFSVPFLILAIVALSSNNIPAWCDQVLPYLTAPRAFSAGIMTSEVSLETLYKPEKIFISQISWLFGCLFFLQYLANSEAWSAWWNKDSSSSSPGSAYADVERQPLVGEDQQQQQGQGQQVDNLSMPLAPGTSTGEDEIDPDVRAEAIRVQEEIGKQNSDSTDLIFGSKLKKVYHGVTSGGGDGGGEQPGLMDHCKNMCAAKVDKVAVKDVSISLRGGETLGIIGRNGEGKSTTVRALTQQENPTGGVVETRLGNMHNLSAECLSFPPSTDRTYFETRYGLVPQHDALFENLTAVQHLELFLAIRLGGLYNPEDWIHYIDSAIQRVTLDNAYDKCSKEFSGGMKRKLALSCALFTGAQVIFCDEADAGVDAGARKQLWKALRDAFADPVRGKKSSVAYVSHHLESVENCTKVLMIKSVKGAGGTVVCFGSPQRLKEIYGSGYQLFLHLDEGKIKEKGLTIEDHRHAVDVALTKILRDQHNVPLQPQESVGSNRIYSIKSSGAPVKLSVIFKVLESQKEELLIADYSCSQVGSLEQIFIRFNGTRAGDDEN